MRPRFTLEQDVDVRLLNHNEAAATGVVSVADVDLGDDHGGACGCAFLIIVDSVSPGGLVEAYITQKHPGAAAEGLSAETRVVNVAGQGGCLLTEIVRPRRRVVALHLERTVAASRILAVIAFVHGGRRPQHRQRADTFPAAPGGVQFANAPGSDG